MDDEAYKVQGSLAYLLRLSRAMGIAPLHFAHDRGGYVATVSRPAAIYGCIFTFGIQFCGLTVIYKKIVELDKQFSIGELFILFTIIIITGVGSYGGIDRMKKMAKLSNFFNKMYYDLNGNIYIRRNKNRFVIINSIATMLFIALFITSECLTFDKKHTLIEVFEMIFNIEYYIMYLLCMENAFINFDVYYMLQSISVKFRELIDKKNSAATCQLSFERFRDLAKAYVSTYDMTKQLSATRGGIMFMLLSANTLFLMMTLFNLIDVLLLIPGGKEQIIFVCVQLLWCAYHLSVAILFVEPWHQTSMEVSEIQILLSKLILNVTPAGKRIPLELDLMFKQLLLNQPTMSPMAMFTVQRSLLSTVILYK